MTDRERLLDLWASGATASEIAGELGVSRENVKSVVKRARAKGDLRAVRHGVSSRRTIVAWVDQAVAPALARAPPLVP
jgi:DNA-binding CsgD family transcriptional regulator